jgi:hypothetical protein
MSLNKRFPIVIIDNRANFKTPPFIRFLRQAKILILRIPNVCLRLKFLPSLNLNKNDHFENGSIIINIRYF